MTETNEESQLIQHFKCLKIELDAKDNQLWEYKQQLGLIKEKEDHYLHNIEILQNNNRPEVNKLQDRIKQLREEQRQLRAQIDSDMLLHDKEFNRLRDELKVHSENAIAFNEKTLASTTDQVSDENFLLKKELRTFSSQLCEKQSHLNNLEEQNSKLLESRNNLCSDLQQVKQSVECSKLELVEAYDLINNLQETIFIKKTELNSVKGKLVNADKDENSLFAEVNDRRLKFQETLLNLSEKCNKMKLEISKKQKQISTLRLHSEELTNLLKNDPIEHQQDYKIMIDTYISRLTTLEHLSEGYKKLLAEKEKLLQNGLPSNIMEFLNDVNERSRKMQEELKETIGMEFRAQKMMSIQLKEINLTIQEWKTTIDQLRIKLLECEDSIQKLKLQYSNQPPTINDKDERDYSINEGKCKVKQEMAQECQKENTLINANTSSKKPIEKRVLFTEDTKVSSNHVIRRGGRVLQCKSVHISNLIKKK